MPLRRLTVALASLVAALGFTVLTERPALAYSCVGGEPAANLVAEYDVAFIGVGVAYTPGPVELAAEEQRTTGTTRPLPTAIEHLRRTGVASVEVQEAVKGVKEGDTVSVLAEPSSFPLGEQVAVVGPYMTPEQVAEPYMTREQIAVVAPLTSPPPVLLIDCGSPTVKELRAIAAMERSPLLRPSEAGRAAAPVWAVPIVVLALVGFLLRRRVSRSPQEAS